MRHPATIPTSGRPPKYEFFATPHYLVQHDRQLSRERHLCLF